MKLVYDQFNFLCFLKELGNSERVTRKLTDPLGLFDIGGACDQTAGSYILVNDLDVGIIWTDERIFLELANNLDQQNGGGSITKSDDSGEAALTV